MASGGGLLSRYKACFSNDGNFMLVPCAQAIRVYEYPAGRLARKLYGHTADVTAVATLPHKANSLLSCSLDGALREWDLSSGQCCATYQLQDSSVHSMAVTGQNGQEIVHLLCTSNQKDHGTCRVKFFSLSTRSLLSHMIHVPCHPTTLVGCSAGGLCATFGRRSIFVWSADQTSGKKSTVLKLYHTKAIRCVAFDPSADRLAAGDSSGRITTWFGVAEGFKCFAEQERTTVDSQPTFTSSCVHWHASSMGGLAFSTDGAYMASGGKEAVLVLWQTGSDKRSYLPRLGGAIGHISTHPTQPAVYLEQQADNTVRAVNMATMTIITSIHGICPLPPSPARGPSTISAVLQPSTGHLVLPADNCVLHLFDPVKDCSVSRVQVVPRNLVAWTNAEEQRPDDQYTTTQPAVERCAFRRDGGMMVTVDVRPTAGPRGGVVHAIKFWDVEDDPGAGPYSVNTLVDDPHRSPVSSVCVHPRGHCVVSTSRGGEMKMWECRSRKLGLGEDKTSSTHFWRCRSVASYGKVGMHSSCFSADGSVLSVGCDDMVTLWEADSNTLAATIALPALPAAATFVGWVPDTPYLVAYCEASRPYVTVLNSLTTSPLWNLHITATAVAVDPVHPVIALAVQRSTSSSTSGSASSNGVGGTHEASGDGDGVQATGQASKKKGRTADGARGADRLQGSPASTSGSSVLLFGVDPPSLLQCWHMNTHSPVVQLMFAQHGTPLAEAALPFSPKVCSPLVALTADSRYGVLCDPSAQPPPHQQPQPIREEGTAGHGQPPLSANMKTIADLTKPGDEEDRLASAVLSGVAGRMGGASSGMMSVCAISSLFDAPSHALPPVKGLCTHFLEAVLAKTAAG